VPPALGDPAWAGGWAGGPTEGPANPPMLGFWDSLLASQPPCRQWEGFTGGRFLAFCWASRAAASAKFRYRWEVVVIFLLDIWAGLPGSGKPPSKGPSPPPSPEKPAAVRLCRGAEPSSGVPKGGFISVGAWAGLCFGQGEVPPRVTAPSAFSARSHLNRAVLSRTWRL